MPRIRAPKRTSSRIWPQNIGPVWFRLRPQVGGNSLGKARCQDSSRAGTRFPRGSAFRPPQRRSASAAGLNELHRCGYTPTEPPCAFRPLSCSPPQQGSGTPLPTPEIHCLQTPRGKQNTNAWEKEHPSAEENCAVLFRPVPPRWGGQARRTHDSETALARWSSYRSGGPVSTTTGRVRADRCIRDSMSRCTFMYIICDTIEYIASRSLREGDLSHST